VSAKILTRRNATTIEIAKRTLAGIRAGDVFGRAAQLAYYFFLALFPFLICVIASLSMFGTADRGRYLIFGLLVRFLPAPAFQLISATFSQIIEAGGPLKMSFGIVFSLWSASMGMSAIMDTLNGAYKAVETRSLAKQYAVATCLTLAVALLLVVSILVVLLGEEIAGRPSFGVLGWIAVKILQWILGFASLLLTLEVIYYFGPNIKNRQWKWITPGAIASILLLAIVSLGLRIYLRLSGSYGSAYGSLGAVIVLLLFFYVSGVAVLFGGVLNGILEDVGRDKEM
jgi:membrane protein